MNPVSGDLYVTFPDNPAGADKADVYLVTSSDGGATWSPRVRVNDDTTTTDQWQPTIAASTDGSKLAIFYYSREEDTTGNNLFKYYGRIGNISGSAVTFSPSFAVSDVASLPEFGRDSVVNGTYMGDYDRAVATPGAFHVTWADNRDDLSGGGGRKDPNVYYERIDLGLAVIATDPAVGSVVSTPPTTFTVDVTEPIDATTLSADDFVVNGIPAATYSYLAGSTSIEFVYASSPVTAEGSQTMSIAAGAFVREADGDPVAPFTGSFRYDAAELEVVATAPPVGGVFTLPGPFTYDVTFNEPVDPTSVQIGDLLLGGIGGAFVSGVTVLPGDLTARFTIGGVVSEGELDATIPAGAVTDVFGNPNLAFSGTYQVDIDTAPFPTPLDAKDPAGSLIYDPAAAGVINFAGDTDNFTLAVDSDQTLTVLVEPTSAVAPILELRNPSGALIGSTSGASGEVALLQTVAASSAGTYTISVIGDGAFTGAYSLSVILNAALEEESVFDGSDNDTIGDAQVINTSFIDLTTSLATASRGAALGVADAAGYSAQAVAYEFEDISGTGTVITGLTGADDGSANITPGFSFTLYANAYSTFNVNSNGTISLGGANSAYSNTDLTTSPSVATIAPFWDDLHMGGGEADSNAYYAVLGSGASERLVIQWNNIRFFGGGSTGDTLTFQAVLFVDGSIQFNYADLVSGSAFGNNGGSATVGIKNTGPQGPDRMLLAFNDGPNMFVGTGQSTLISPPDPTADLYRFAVGAGETLSLGVKALTDGMVSLDLLDSFGGLLVSGVSASNLDQVINNYAFTVAGDYFASVTASAVRPFMTWSSCATPRLTPSPTTTPDPHNCSTIITGPWAPFPPVRPMSPRR